MEQKERMLLEIIVGIVFVLFLILGSVVVINASEGTEIENSYNTYNTYVTQDAVKPYIVDSGDYQKVYYVHRDTTYARESDKSLGYYDRADHKTFTGAFGNDVNDYEVYVANREYVGGYFKVVYYFTDAYGRTQTQVVNNYVPAREEKRFFMRDVSDKYRYINWDYKVESLSKTPMRVYYGG